MFLRILTLAIYTVVVVNGQDAAGFYCPPDYTVYSQEPTCLKFYTNTESFSGAKQTCQDNESSLVIIRDSAKDVYIGTFTGTNVRVWHGVEDPNFDLVFSYVDGTAVSDTYSPWVADPTASEACASRITKSNNQIDWAAHFCTDTFGFVCEKPALFCPPGWVMNTIDNLCMKTVKGKKKTFNEARAYCQAHMGDLATRVMSGRELALVMKNKRFRGQFWIGVYDSSLAGEFSYIDGTDVDPDQPFKRKTPKNPANEHYCVAMKKGQWYSKNCGKKLFFICQKSANWTTNEDRHDQI